MAGLDDETWAASEAYFEKFGVRPSIPVGVGEDEMRRVWLEAVASGEPVPEDYDWWDSLPPGAVS
jgi:hypothetical protein